MLQVCARFLLLLIAVALFLASCVPILHVPEEVPYKDVATRLTLGTSTRSEVVALLGEPPIRRGDGRLVIYGTDREFSGLLFILPPLGPAFVEEFHYLFLEFDDVDVLQWWDLVILPSDFYGHGMPEICDSRGRCVVYDESSLDRGNLAVVSASQEEEALMRQMEPPETGCRIYLFGRDQERQMDDWLLSKAPGQVYLALDDHPRYSYPYRNKMFFAAWNETTGQHTVRATTLDEKLLAEFPVECATGTLIAVVAETVPTFLRINPRVEFTVVDKQEAQALMADRRLVLE
jgi:hypothetical protein